MRPTSAGIADGLKNEKSQTRVGCGISVGWDADLVLPGLSGDSETELY